MSCPIEGDQPLTDALALIWVRDQLVHSGLFEHVQLGRFARDVGDNGYPAAWISPLGFTETDEVDPVQITRSLKYAVSLVIKPEDPDDEIQSITDLDGLSNSVADLLSAGAPYGALNGLTRIESGRYEQPNNHTSPRGPGNTMGLTLTGTVAYLIDGRGGRPEEFGD